MRQDDNRVSCTWRLPKPLIEKLHATVKRLSPHVRDYTHGVEIAIHEWVKKNETSNHGGKS